MTLKWTIIVISLLANFAGFSQQTKGFLYQTNKFAIVFPAQPQQSTQQIPSALGELTMHITVYEPAPAANDENYAYLLMESTYPDSTIHSSNKELLDSFFRKSIDGAVTSVQGKLLSEKAGSFEGFPSRNIEIDFGSGQAVIKMFMLLTAQTMVMVQTITLPANMANAAQTAFFNSFRLK